MSKSLCLLLAVIVSFSLNAQSFSNKGKDFWVGYGYHQAMVDANNNNLQNLVLYFTADASATVKVEIPGVGWSRTYAVAANSVTESDPMPKTGAQDSRLFVEGITNRGIHITSDKPIVAYAHIYNQNVSGATLLFPVNTLGQDYYSLNFTQRSNAQQSNSWAYVIATEDSTAVEITPSANTLTKIANVPFIVTLNKGEIFNLMGTVAGTSGVDLTGTRIRSVNLGVGGCKRIAVFSGSGRVAITCATPTSSDNLIQQVFPQNAWGKQYLTVPTEKLKYNYFRVAVSNPSTVVKINGVTATGLINNFYYEFLTNEPQSITSDQPVMVAQYITSTNAANGMATCGNTNGNSGDPEMIYLSPIEQTIDKITLNSTNYSSINYHYINVIIKTIATSKFTLDGVNRGPSFIPHPKDTLFSYAIFNVVSGRHTLRADSGFNAIAYGYGNFESYGYNAGTNIKDLNQFISLQNQYTKIDYPATCLNTSFALSVTLPYQPSSMTWDFGNNPNVTPNVDVVKTNPVADSIFIKDGRTLYVYKIPGLYKYTAVGTYPVKIQIVTANAGGCSGLQELTFDVEVFGSPISSFNVSHVGCPSDPIKLINLSSSPGRVISNYIWDFGDGTFDTSRNPIKVFSPGSYNIKQIAINDIGCSAEETKGINISSQPIANFGLSSSSACINTSIQISDSSSILFGSIVKWYWKFGNNDSITRTSNVPFNKNFSNPGNIDIQLQVENSSGCKSLIKLLPVNIIPKPIAKFKFPVSCISDPTVTFTDSSYVPGNPTAVLNYLWNFGDTNSTASNPDTSILVNPQHIFSKAGKYIVSLTVTTINGCSSTTVRNLIVNDAPIADFIVQNNDTLCSAYITKIINKTTIGTGSVSKVEIIWDSINNPSIIETDLAPLPGKAYNHQYPNTSSLSSTYRISFKAYSGTTCISEKLLDVIIHPSPKVTFDPVTPFCITDNDRLISQGSEIRGIAGSFIYKGNGINTIGNFSPALAGIGQHAISYIFTSFAGCSDSASQLIDVIKLPTVELPQQISVLEGGNWKLEPEVTGSIVKYQWFPSTFLDNSTFPRPTTTPKSNIRYRLTVTTNGGCSANDSIDVIVLPIPIIPNAFSPNGDGINDKWNIGSLNSYVNCTVQVFNRFGHPVFQSFGYNKPWDGGNLPAGVYYYIIDPKNGRKTFTGSLTIIR